MKKGKNIFWGLLFILGAVFIVVNRLGYFQDISVLTVIFTIIVAGVLIDSIAHRSFGGILFSLAFLCILYDKPLGMEALTPWPVLAAALCGTIGLNMIFKEKKEAGAVTSIMNGTMKNIRKSLTRRVKNGCIAR